MPLFNRTDAKVEAVQWFKEGDHPDVEVHPRELYLKGNFGYIHHLYPMATHWLSIAQLEKPPVDEGAWMHSKFEFKDKDTGHVYYREALSFHMWSVKGDKRTVQADDSPEYLRLFEDCLMVESFFSKRPISEYSTYGLIQKPEINDRKVVYPGNWIVKYDGKREILEDAAFKLRYTPA